LTHKFAVILSYLKTAHQDFQDLFFYSEGTPSLASPVLFKENSNSGTMLRAKDAESMMQVEGASGDQVMISKNAPPHLTILNFFITNFALTLSCLIEKSLFVE
jgi:hypothetical protein